VPVVLVKISKGRDAVGWNCSVKGAGVFQREGRAVRRFEKVGVFSEPTRKGLVWGGEYTIEHEIVHDRVLG